MAKNRRRYARKTVALRVDGADTTGRAWMALANNISSGGLRLAHPTPVSVGDTLTIAFVLPGDQPCKISARVVRADETGCALEFLQSVPSVLSQQDQCWVTLESSEEEHTPTRHQASGHFQSAAPTAERIAEHMLAQWFGSHGPLSEDPLEALDQIFPAAEIQAEGMDAEYTTACAAQLMETLEQFGDSHTASPEVVAAALEHWSSRVLALYQAIEQHAAALISTIDRTKPQTVLHAYRRFLARRRPPAGSPETPRYGRQLEALDRFLEQQQPVSHGQLAEVSNSNTEG